MIQDTIVYLGELRLNESTSHKGAVQQEAGGQYCVACHVLCALRFQSVVTAGCHEQWFAKTQFIPCGLCACGSCHFGSQRTNPLARVSTPHSPMGL